MNDQQNEPNPYNDWIARRRDAHPDANLPDQVMNQLADLQRHRNIPWWLPLVEQIERRRSARFAACVDPNES